MSRSKILLVLASLFTYSLYSQTFEGKIHFLYETADGQFQGVYWYSAPRTAFELIQEKDGTSFSSVTFYKPASHTIEIKSHTPAGKHKFVYDAESVSSRFGYETNQTAMLPTGESVVIAGVSCQKYQIITPEYIVTAFINPEILVEPRYFSLYLKDDPAIQIMAKSGIKGFPFQTIVKDSKGNTLWKTTVTSISEERISETSFEIGSEFVEIK